MRRDQFGWRFTRYIRQPTHSEQRVPHHGVLQLALERLDPSLTRGEGLALARGDLLAVHHQPHDLLQALELREAGECRFVRDLLEVVVTLPPRSTLAVVTSHDRRSSQGQLELSHTASKT